MFAEPYLSALRAGTQSFIAFAPINLALEMHERVPDGAGGFKIEHTNTRWEQTFTLVEPRNSGYGFQQAIPEGTNTLFDFMLVGEHDATVGEHDQFLHDGIRYRVETILPHNGYEVRAMILRRHT